MTEVQEFLNKFSMITVRLNSLNKDIDWKWDLKVDSLRIEVKSNRNIHSFRKAIKTIEVHWDL